MQQYILLKLVNYILTGSHLKKIVLPIYIFCIIKEMVVVFKLSDSFEGQFCYAGKAERS